MNQNRTMSILQRVPVILAVTAASYGLTYAQTPRAGAASAGGKTGTSLNHQHQQRQIAAQSR